MTDSALVDLAQSVLSALVNHWPAVPSSNPDLPNLADLPDRQYVNIGTTAADCEQLVVSIERAFGSTGSPAVERVVEMSDGVPWLRTMTASIQILRCAIAFGPDGKSPPDPLVKQVEAQTILTDADAVLNCIIIAQAAGELATCNGLALEGWRAVTAQGGLAGGETRVRMSLFG